jgi:hypothetical protein
VKSLLVQCGPFGAQTVDQVVGGVGAEHHVIGSCVVMFEATRKDRAVSLSRDAEYRESTATTDARPYHGNDSGDDPHTRGPV